MIRKIKKYLYLLLIFSLFNNVSVIAQQYIDNSKTTITLPKDVTKNNSLQNFRSHMPPPKIPSFNELVLPSSYPYTYLEAVNLEGMKIKGLTDSSIALLNKSYFVVVNNTDFKLMSDIYQNNRKINKTSYITLDYIWHCYMGVRNSISFNVAKNFLYYDLQNCLKAMLIASESDYKICEDVNIKADIKENSKFIKTALFILDPIIYKQFANTSDPNIAQINKIPTGFYNCDKSVNNLIRCLYYISCLELPLIEDSDQEQVNNFRRSILLCRAIANAKLNTESGLSLWKRISSAQSAIFPSLNNLGQNKLYPNELSSKFFGQNINPDEFLKKLSDPLFRTQLLLTIRHEKPTRLNSSSILALNNSIDYSPIRVSFRLLPNLVDPSYLALKQVSSEIVQSNTSRGAAPLSLIYLQSLKALTANDILRQFFPKLSPNITKWLNFMDLCQSGYIQRSNTKIAYDTYVDWRYNLIAPNFALTKARSQMVIGSTGWMTRQLESIMSMWLDSNLSCLPTPVNKTLPKINFNPYGNVNYKILFHFLEPASDTYLAMRKDALKTMDELQNIGYFPSSHKQMLENFMYILEKLNHIATLEIKNEKVSLKELYFLGNIDLYLRDYDTPMLSYLSLPLEVENKYLNLDLGYPGYLNIILLSPEGATLARGALYTYCEETGSCQTSEHLKRQIEYNTIRPPFWLSAYDVVQEDLTTK